MPYIEKNASDTRPYYHDIIVYNLTVTNTGNITYDKILTIVDELPEGIVYISYTLSGANETAPMVQEGQKLTWTITNITAGATAVINVTVQLNVTGETDNPGVLIFEHGDNQTVNKTIDIQPIVDLAVNKTSDKTDYFVGDIVTWTITVTNAWNGTNATNVTLKDILPVEVEFINCTTENGTYNNETGNWTIGFMGNGTTATLTIVTRALIEADNVTNTGNATCNEEEWNYTNNVDNATINIYDKPDINKTVNDTNPKYSEFVLYNITVRNTGDISYTDNLTIIDSLPEGIDYISSVVIGGTQIGNTLEEGRVTTWVITNIAPHSSVVIQVTAQANAVGEKVNNATIKYPDGTDMTVNATIVVDPNVDLSVNKTSDKTDYFVGDIVTWTITVYNARNGTNATNVTLKDILPVEVEFINYTATNGTYDNETGIWNIGFMENGTNATLTIVTRALIEADNVTNTGNVSCNESEMDYTNNVDNATINIHDVPDIFKDVNYTDPYYHETVVYNITVSNTGNVTYENVLTIVDNLPEGIDYINSTVTGANETGEMIKDGQKLTWTITNIAAGETAVIYITVQCNAIGVKNNTGTINYPDGKNKTVNRTINVHPIVDVSVIKTSDRTKYFVDDIVIWTISVYNADNGTNATEVSVKDILPSEFVFINCTTENGTYNNETGNWTIGFMGNGTTATLTITSIAKAEVDNVTNIANVTCNETEWNYTNNVDNATVGILPLPDPVKTVNETTPYYHNTVDYNLTIINTGDITYENNLTVIDSLPEGLLFIETVNITGAKLISENKDGQIITWVITNITPETHTVITVRVQANALGNLTNNLTIVGPNGTNKTVNCTITPRAIVDVSVNKTSDKAQCFVDDIVVWTVTVRNADNGTNATNVILTDILPSEFVFINWTATNGTYNNNTGKWTIGFMGNGTNATLTITSRAKKEAKKVTNIASVTCSEDEWNYTNNVDNASVEIIPLPDPVKTVNNATPYYHDVVFYNLTIINTGNITYTDELKIIDSLPAGLEFIETVGTTGANVLSENVDGQVITWMITDIGANSKAIITVKVRANALGNLTNNLTLIGPNGTNKTVNCTVTPVPVVDVSVNKISDKGEYFVDDIVVWTIKVSNAANGTNATNVVLKDLLPVEFKFIKYTATKGKYNSTSGEWIIGFMGNGTSATLTITSLAKKEAKKVTNVAKVSCKEHEWNYTNNVDNASVVINPFLIPKKTVSNKTPYNYETVEYNLTIYNNGNMTYDRTLTVIDSLPKGLKYKGTVSISGADQIGETVVNGQKITWKITNIAAHSKAVITVKVQATKTGKLTNNLTIVGPNGKSATVNCTISPVPVADLQVIKTNNYEGKKVRKGETVIWKIKVTNNGPDKAINAIARDKLPKGVIYLSDDSNGKYDPETGIWKIGNLAKGESATLTIKTKVTTTNKNVTNPVVVSSDSYDPDKSNNYDNSTINVIAQADLELTKEANVTYVLVNQTVSFKITVVNHGPNTAVNVRVHDVLPESLKFVSFKASRGTYDNETGLWTIGDLKKGEKVYLEITVNATEKGKVTNVAYVKSDTYDNDTSNNRDSATVEVDEPQTSIKLYPTGNPIILVLLSLVTIVGITLRRKS